MQDNLYVISFNFVSVISFNRCIHAFFVNVNYANGCIYFLDLDMDAFFCCMSRFLSSNAVLKHSCFGTAFFFIFYMGSFASYRVYGATQIANISASYRIRRRSCLGYLRRGLWRRTHVRRKWAPQIRCKSPFLY